MLVVEEKKIIMGLAILRWANFKKNNNSLPLSTLLRSAVKIIIKKSHAVYVKFISKIPLSDMKKVIKITCTFSSSLLLCFGQS